MIKLGWPVDVRFSFLLTLLLTDLNASNERTNTLITVADKDVLKLQVIPATIALSGASDKCHEHAQIASPLL